MEVGILLTPHPSRFVKINDAKRAAYIFVQDIEKILPFFNVSNKKPPVITSGGSADMVSIIRQSRSSASLGFPRFALIRVRMEALYFSVPANIVRPHIECDHILRGGRQIVCDSGYNFRDACP